MNDLANKILERHTLISPINLKDVVLTEEDISIMSSKPWHIQYNYLSKDFRDWRIGDQVVALVVMQDRETAQVVLTSKVLVQHMCIHNLIEMVSDDGTILVIRGTENGKIPPREIYT